MTVLFGAVPDDFTGASDLADTLVREKLRVVQIIAVPDQIAEIRWRFPTKA